MSGGTAPRRPTVAISTRLVAGAMVWLVLLLVLGGAVLALAFRDTVEQEFGHRLDAMLRAMIAATEVGTDGTVTVVRTLGDPRFDQIFSGWYWQVSEPSGRMVRSRSLWDSTIPIAGGQNAHKRRIDGPRGQLLLAVERDLEFPDAPGPVHVLIAGDLGEVRAGVRRFDMLLAASLGLLGAGMAVAVFIQVWFGLRPLRAMKADLDAVRDGERPRLSENYPREVTPLAEAMNGVLDNDAELIERARTHVGNLAHGLKTPLTILQAELDSTPNKEILREQIGKMKRLIEHHLGRASAVAGAGRVLGIRVPVQTIAKEIAGVLSHIHADRRLAIDVDVPDDATFRGHREDLEEILGNLMENACKWAKTRVRISAEMGKGELALSVEDDGPGMSPEQAKAAARRGERLDVMAPGSGLGLSIVADLVAVNGGTMTFGRSAMGGLAVTLMMRGPRRGEES